MRRLIAPAAMAVVAAGLSGCQVQDEDVIALLLPDLVTDRWEHQDRPAFEEAVRANCLDCVVKVYNAATSAATQQDQLTEAKQDGADVIVLAAVDSDAGESMVRSAGDIPVIAYDRFVGGADYYVSFDSSQVGTLQAEALVAEAGSRPHILMINGEEGDPNATALKLAAHEVFERAGVRVLAEEDPEDWHADTAKAWVADQIERLGDRRIDAVYAANDSEAEGVVQAFREAKRALPVITGQDGELAALHRIVLGEQTMTVYKSVPDEADRAAKIAVALIAGRAIGGTTDHEGVPSVIFDPVAVTVDNLTNTVVRDGVYSVEAICTPELRKRCEALGIS